MQGAPKLRVAIVGSGLAGLSTAVELLEQGYEVDVYESRPFIGGKVASWQKDGNHVEMGLHVVRPSPPSLSLCRGTQLSQAAPPPSPAWLPGRQHGCHACSLAGSSSSAWMRWGILEHVHVRAQFFGCYFNLFRLMAKCGVLENLLLKEHVHTFVNTGGDVRELDFRFHLGGRKIGAPFHGLKAFFTTPQLSVADKARAPCLVAWGLL